MSNHVADFIVETYFKDAKPAAVATPVHEADFAQFHSMVLHNKVAPYMHTQLKKMQHPWADSLASEYTKIRTKNIERLQAGLPILKALQARGVDVIILKGNALAEEVFGDIGYKPMNDIDILVRQKDLDVVFAVFQEHHLVSAGALDEDFRKQEKYSHHWPPFFTKNLDCFLGTHWNLAASGRGLNLPVEAFWQDKEQFLLQGQPFYRLEPHHFLLHLCVHLSPVKTGLREIGDINKFVAHRLRDLDATKFLQIVREAKAEACVYEALTLAKALSSQNFFSDVLKELALVIAEKTKHRVQKRAHPRRKILLMRTSYISKIEKAFALFMLTESPLEKTFLLGKMWKHFLLVPMDEACRLGGVMPEANIVRKMLAVVQAPLKISQVFAQDLGTFVFIFVTIRHEYVLLASLGNYLVKKAKGLPIKDLKSVAKMLGLDMARIKEISALD